tara:strand:+ start:5963 stop:6973 length:1011 start_codon:yes stop_codon:yes gene_type:complete
MVKNKVFIIAEAGCNHNGELKLAKKLIDIAKRAKADAVKFQSFKVEELAVKNAPKANYAISNTKFYKTQYEMQSRLQLSFNDQLKLLKYCKKKRIKFLSSSFDVQSTEDLKKMNLDIIKIPSGEITNLPNLIKIGSLKKKIILSTGMSTIREIKQAIKILNQKGTNQKDITLLHCTTDYPAKLKDINLLAIRQLRKIFNMKVGYSDHTNGIEVSIAAAALGASVIEKHITLSRELEGPDHYASLEENEFTKMVQSIRNLEIAMGNGKKKPTQNEIKNIYTVRKSIKARKFINKGEVFSEENLLVARPNSGLSPMKWDKIVGKKAKKSFNIGEDIKI